MKCSGCGNEIHCCLCHGTMLEKTPEAWKCLGSKDIHTVVRQSIVSIARGQLPMSANGRRVLEKTVKRTARFPLGRRFDLKGEEA